MKEGVIVDISRNKLTVLTPEGDFLELKNNHEFNQIGDLIYFEPQALHGIKRTLASGKKTTIKTIIALAASMLLIFNILPIVLEDSKVYAYVSLDMDSNIEFSVSEDMEVLDIQGIDQEGKEMLTDLEWLQNQDVAIVVAQILLLLQKEGKMEDKNEVVFSTVVLDKDEKLEENLEKKLTNVQAAEVNSLRIETQKATVDDRQKAKEQGLSTAAYLEVQTEKETVKKEDRKGNTSKIENRNTSEETTEDSAKQQQSNPKGEQKAADDRKSSSSSKEEKETKADSPTSKGQKKDSTNGAMQNKKEISKPITSERRNQKRNVSEKKQDKAEKTNQQWQSNKRESNDKKSIKSNDYRDRQIGKSNEWNKQNDLKKKNEQQKRTWDNREKNDKGQRGNHEDKRYK